MNSRELQRLGRRLLVRRLLSADRLGISRQQQERGVVIPTGQRVGGYEVGRWIARGGMSAVYEGWRIRDRLRVCLKFCVPPTDAWEEEWWRARFQRELQLARRMKHPHVARLMGHGEWNGAPFAAIEYIAGPSLAEVMGAGSAPGLERSVGLMCQVASGLGHAHARGVVHRDIKPGNILVERWGGVKRERAVLIDFGLGRSLYDAGPLAAQTLTRAGDRLGTPAYMAPEQWMGGAREAGPASDTYSLCLVLFHLVMGRLPRPDEPERGFPESPAPLREIFARGLAWDPSRRFGTGEDLCLALMGTGTLRGR